MTENSTKKTLIVNLYAGPGAGKSTAAAYLFARLKMNGISAEYVTEYAKDATWEGATQKLNCQFYISGKQAYRIFRVCGKVDVLVTDSPLALGAVYTDEPLLQQLCIAEAKKYDADSVNLFIRRIHSYDPNGRNQTEAESIKLDDQIRELLDSNGMSFHEIDATETVLDDVVREITCIVCGTKSPSEFQVTDGGRTLHNFAVAETPLLIGDAERWHVVDYDGEWHVAEDGTQYWEQWP